MHLNQHLDNKKRWTNSNPEASKRSTRMVVEETRWESYRDLRGRFNSETSITWTLSTKIRRDHNRYDRKRIAEESCVDMKIHSLDLLPNTFCRDRERNSQRENSIGQSAITFVSSDFSTDTISYPSTVIKFLVIYLFADRLNYSIVYANETNGCYYTVFWYFTSRKTNTAPTLS